MVKSCVYCHYLEDPSKMLRASSSSRAPPYELKELWVQNGAEAIPSESAYYGAKHEQEGRGFRKSYGFIALSLVLRRRREEGGGSEQFVL